MAATIRRWILGALWGACSLVQGSAQEWVLESPLHCTDVTRLEITSPPFHLEESTDGIIPRIPGAMHAISAGQPDLPYFVKVISIPTSCVARVKVNRLDTSETNIAKIATALAPTVDYSSEEPSASLRRSEAGPAYFEDAFWPESSIQISYAVQAGQRWARIVFYPLQFNPVRGILRWVKKVEADLEWGLAGSGDPNQQ